MTASATQKVSLNDLPRDVLAYIFELLQCTSPGSVRSLSAVSSLFHSLAQYASHSNLILDISDDKTQQFAKQCKTIVSEELQLAVRQITIWKQERGFHTTEDSSWKQRLDMVCQLLPSLSGLRSVEYRNAYIPRNMLSVLNKTMPHVALHTSFPVWIDHNNTDERLPRLHGNINLRSLDVQITRVEADMCQRLMRPLKQVLLSCPNLRCLSLDVSQPTSGCVAYGPTEGYVGLGFKEGEVLPALEELTLIQYPFGHEPSGATLDFNCQGYPGSGNEVDYWADRFDWSRLRKLKVDQSHYFALKAAKHFTALREVEFTDIRSDEYLPVFFNAIPNRLSAISAPNLGAVGLEGVFRQGEALESLHLHHTENYSGGWISECVDVATLTEIRSRCVNIRHMSLNMPRSGAWPYSIFDEMAVFPKLKSLAIWFELGVGQARNPIEPFVTYASAKRIYEYLNNQRRAHDHQALQTLELHSGAIPISIIGFASPESFWPKYNSTSFICELSERDGEAKAGVFCTKCPKLDSLEQDLRDAEKEACGSGSRLVKKFGQALTGATEKRKARDAENWRAQRESLRDEARIVAFEGPRPMGQWKAHY